MGYGARGNGPAPLPRLLRTRLDGLRVAVDVQHLYKTASSGDRGAEFVLAGFPGLHLSEATAVTVYAQALVAWLTARGAAVLTNSPAAQTLVGGYYGRQKEAERWQADAYLACHLNAGNGSYAMVEYATGSGGLPLATRIGAHLTDTFPEILSYKAVSLAPVARGFVCIGGFPTARAAVLVAPFFGDNARQQALLTTPKLVAIGEAIGEGVARWWESVRASRLI